MHDVVLDTIFDKLDFITDAFPTKPKAENFLAFFLGISLCPLSTLKGFSEWLDGWKNQSSLNRFLTSGCWNPNDLQKMSLKWLAEVIAASHQTIYLIIDDSKAKKTGKFIEKVYFDHDTSIGKSILCHTFLTSILRIGSLELPFATELYDKTKKHKPGFKSKLDIANEHIEAFLRIVPFKDKIVILFDSWYCAAKIISKLPSDVSWVSRLKRNRTIKIDGFWFKPDEILSCVKTWNFKRIRINGESYWGCPLRVEVKELGVVTLIIVKKKRYSKYAEFFVSNIDAPAKIILQHYSQRWRIEVFFRSIKQDFGMGGYQMRKFKGIRRYWALVLLTYTIVSVLRNKWKKTCRTIGEAIAKLRALVQKQAQDYGRSYGAMIENYVEEKNAKL